MEDLDFTFGINYNIEGIGYINTQLAHASRHEAKHKAGCAFHLPYVKSVCVYDPSGTARLYLKKTENGVIREEH